MKKIIVIKYGGSILHDQKQQQLFLQELSILSHEYHIVLVHGGGAEISAYSKKLGIEPVFYQGRRVTDQGTLEIVQMVLCGKVNKALVCALNQYNIHAIGISGQDAKTIRVKPKDPQLGFVGEIEHCDPTLFYCLFEKNYVPVVASVAIDQEGQSYNVNADDIAASIASALQADKLIFMTDVNGVYLNKDDPSSLIPDLSIPQLKTLMLEKKISDGMIPKLESCLYALENKVKNVLVGKTVICC